MPQDTVKGLTTNDTGLLAARPDGFLWQRFVDGNINSPDEAVAKHEWTKWVAYGVITKHWSRKSRRVPQSSDFDCDTEGSVSTNSARNLASCQQDTLLFFASQDLHRAYEEYIRKVC